MGGKIAEKENDIPRSEIKSRALSELMSSSSEVFITGHKEADLDSIGSSIGLCVMARSVGKAAYIIMNSVSSGIKSFYDRAEAEGLGPLFISEEEAFRKAAPSSLLIVTDTHRRCITEASKMLDAGLKISVIDHHRKSGDFIEDAALVYHEPYASSTSELVTEMLRNSDKDVFLSPIEADALLAGITLDTKNFSVKTGAVTFEAASYLARNGADCVRVRLLFQNDMGFYKARAESVCSAEMLLNGSIAISECFGEGVDSIVLAAQAADELLNIKGVRASFVLCETKNAVYVSARSFGDINVSDILKAFGGGGHKTMSGAQLTGMSIKDARVLVKEEVKKYLKEE